MAYTYAHRRQCSLGFILLPLALLVGAGCADDPDLPDLPEEELDSNIPELPELPDVREEPKLPEIYPPEPEPGPEPVSGCGTHSWTNVTIEDFRSPDFNLTVPNKCVQYCNPSGDFINNPTGNPDGVTCADGSECRYLNGWLGYIDLDDPTWHSDDIGICIDSDWDTCGTDTSHDLYAWACTLDEENISDISLFVPGCSTGTEIAEAIENLATICSE
jgi:hypothetical protein